MTRKEALKLELKTFVSGNRCKWSHAPHRYTKSGACIRCSQIKNDKAKARISTARALARQEEGANDRAKMAAFSIGQRVTWRSPWYGLANGIIVKIEMHHLVITDHNKPYHLEPVGKIRIDWVVE